MAGLHCQENVFAAIAAVAADTPDRVAVIGAQDRLTFGTLVTRAHALAAAVAATPPGAVAIIVPPGPDLAIAFTACAAAGRVAIVLSAAAPDQRNRVILREAGATAVITPIPAQAIALDIATVAMSETPPTPAPPPQGWTARSGDDPAAVAFTSGSTGVPKGVVRTHRRIFDHIASERRRGIRREDDVAICLSEPSSGLGLTSLTTNLVGGATQILMPVAEFGPSGLLRLIEQERATRLVAAPQLLAMLLRRPAARDACAALAWVLIRGDAMLAVDLDIIRRAVPRSCRISYGYGLTETAGVTGTTITADDAAPRTGRVPAGPLLAGVACTIRDEAGALLPAGEVGEIWVSSRDVGVGRWRHGVVVAEDFPPDPDDPTRRVCRTGDLGRFDAGGVLHVLGRRDRQIKINGVRIDMAEVENAVRSAPGVAEAAVIAQEPAEAPSLAAYIVAEPKAPEPVASSVRAHLRAALPAAMHPARIVLVPALPRIGSGKVDARALAERPLEAVSA